MIRLNKNNLPKYIEKYLPVEYHPGDDKVVRAIEMLDSPNLALLATKLLRSPMDEFLLGGLCVDVQELTGRGELRFYIYLKEFFETEEELAFALLHEVGHVDWYVNEKRRVKFKEEENELYADLFAFERIQDISGMEQAVNALCDYASKNGFGKELEEDVG